MKVVHKLATVGAVVAAAALAGAGMASGSHASSSQADASVEKTVVYNGPSLGWNQFDLPPKLTCPADAPYMLNQAYNPGSGFRMARGVELSNYKSGLDAAIERTRYTVVDNKRVSIGLSESIEPIFGNSVTYWGFDGRSSYTLTMHCTSDINRAYWIWDNYP
jgi:hypothetical protein